MQAKMKLMNEKDKNKKRVKSEMRKEINKEKRDESFLQLVERFC